VIVVFRIFEHQQGRNQRFQCWQHENQPFLLDSEFLYNQRLNYLHYNPVAAGFVSEAIQWLYSSANEYASNEKGLLELKILE
jgi:putative transposase